MNRCVLVAEIGINHNGNLELAKKMIDKAAEAGCDFVKFQKRTIEKVYTKEELDRYRQSPWGITNREQKNGLEFGKKEYDIIDYHCRKKGISWFASPWDVESVKFLSQYDPSYIKIASACISDISLLTAIKKTNIPIILSTGMSTKEEIKHVVDFLNLNLHFILACTSTYPTCNEEMNLNFIKTLKKQFPNYCAGFSNHSPGAFYSCVAAALGAEMVEFHFTLDRSIYGSDQASSIETTGLNIIVKHIRNLEKAMGSGNWELYDSEKKIRAKLRK